MNELSVSDQAKILGLLRLGWSERRIARETGHHRKTIRRLKEELEGTPQANSAPESPPAVVVVEETIASRSACEPHRALIEAELRKGRNATAIYQDLVEHHGYTGAYNAVKRFVRTLDSDHEPYAKCRFETAAGEEAQVDYGEGAPTLDPRTGKYRKPRLFVMTLGMSRHAFRKVVWKSSTQTWCELHEEAFAAFGGAPKMVRLDNLREGVIDPDVYDPKLNALYTAMLGHYGVVALPCRPYRPDLKGKVESAVGYTQRTALKGRRFESIQEQNDQLVHWNERWAATRIHGTTKRQVREMFEEERPTLMPLPPTRFVYYTILERRVHLDSYVEVGSAYYSVPPRYVGSTVIVHSGSLWVRIIDPRTQQCIREHAVAPRGARRIVNEDRPKQTPVAVQRIVERVATHGVSCATFARALEAEQGAMAIRALFGLLDLIRKHGAAAVDQACGVAVRIGALRLRFLRAYLASVSKPEPLTDEHPLIEAIATYRTHFDTLK
jgi:transposase